VNTKKKGAMWEKIAEKTMEMIFGLTVHTTERKMVRQAWGGYISLANDIYGCIDHIGKKKGLRKTWWIQTTAGGGIGEKAAEITALDCWGPADLVEIWRGVGGKKGKKWDRTHPKEEGIEIDKWYFQRYRLENNFKMVKGDVIIIPPEVIKAVASKPKAPVCACGNKMKKELEIKIGKCAACIRGETPAVPA
jgi:hypothetical protein